MGKREGHDIASRKATAYGGSWAPPSLAAGNAEKGALQAERTGDGSQDCAQSTGDPAGGLLMSSW